MSHPKHALSKAAAFDLHNLAARINQRQTTIEELRTRTQDYAGQAVAEALLQGQDLIKAQSIVPRPLWPDWLKAQCPTLEPTSARKYISLASQRAIADAQPLRQALLFVFPDHAQPRETHEPKRWPEYQEGVLRLSRALSFIEDHPLTRWPPESQDRARELLAPIVQALWPSCGLHAVD